MLITAATAILMVLQQAPAENTDWDAEFGGRKGIRQIAIRTVDLSEADRRIADIFCCA